MVVGNGMLANAFVKYKEYEKVIIFASGVSNSKEVKKKEFLREKKLLKSYSNIKNKRLIYFSTCSIEDKSLEESFYIIHKIKMEEYIKKNFDNYIIFRLPNVIGNTENTNTFFGFFKKKIINECDLHIQENAIRYIIDIDDLTKYLPGIIEEKLIDEKFSKTINIAFKNKMSVKDIVEIMENILNKKNTKKLKKEGSNYSLDNSIFLKYLKINNYIVDYKNYNEKTLKKYLKK
jgi:nucleoside-diphosphate-sugar epimerase